LISLASGGMVAAAVGVSTLWSLTEAVLGRHSVSGMGARAAYLTYQLLKRAPAREQENGAARRAECAPEPRREAQLEPQALADPPGTDSPQPPAAQGAEPERVGPWLTERMSKPVTGATIAGAVVLGAATAVGVTEAALGAVAAYGTYRVLSRRRSRTSRG
jgi:hypothetical protein